MRLALKLVLVFMLANIALAGIYGYLAVRREVILFQKRAAAEAEEMGPVIEELLADARRRPRAIATSRSRSTGSSRSQQQPLRIRWVSFDTKAEAEFRPAVPAERLTSIVIQEHLPSRPMSPTALPICTSTGR